MRRTTFRVRNFPRFSGAALCLVGPAKEAPPQRPPPSPAFSQPAMSLLSVLLQATTAPPTDDGPAAPAFFGFMGCTAALVFACARPRPAPRASVQLRAHASQALAPPTAPLSPVLVLLPWV